VTESVAAPRGLSRAVVLAAAATAVGVAPVLQWFSDSVVPTGALFGFGWPAFGLVAAVLLDRDPESRPGRAFIALAVVPAVVTAAALLLAGGEASIWPRIERGWDRLGITPVVGAIAVIAWSVDTVSGRMARRRLVWLVVWSSALVVSVLATSIAGGPRAAAAATTLGLWGMAGLVFRLEISRELRPVDEPLIDAGVATATLLFGAAVGTLVRIGGLRAHIPGPDVAGAFAAVVSAALVLPGGLWLRRRFLARRYGPGTLSAADVEQITADLHTRTDVRELLGRAAAMVAAASGHREVGLVLGPDAPDLPAHWVFYPLVVGGDRVGTLFLEPRHREGPEPRQERMVRQLLPTVSLVADAVSLAVEAGHARRDVARQRDAERARILGDLHDGLGPVLVGMSMRVRAELRHRPTPLLEALAAELADCRGDLRRIVSGLTPSVLDDGDLAAALRRLAGSFAGQGPVITIDTGIDGALPPPIAVAVYRSVAEGLTNALRHARAGQVRVDVRTAPGGTVLVDVSDDGAGGPVVPGVGLSSLRRRAEELGGALRITAERGAGTRLHLELPSGPAPAKAAPA
jgi:signal transduction histidine kinase